MRTVLRISAFIVLSAIAGGCASASAKAKPVAPPPLTVPPPPPRVIEPVPAPETLPEPVSDLPPAPPTNRQTRPVTRETTHEQPKSEPKPGEAAVQQPAEVPQPPTAPQGPPPQLRTPATANDTQAENAIRGVIDRGRALLGGVNFVALSNERKKAYQDAKMFLDQAESALKQGNYVFAQGVADKGEKLARELAGK